VVICLEQGADCLHMVQLMRLHPKTPSPLASLKSRLVLHFWCRLTHFVLEKRPLNGCSSSSSCCFLLTLLLGVERCRHAERCPPSVRNGRNPSVYWSPRKKNETRFGAVWRNLRAQPPIFCVTFHCAPSFSLICRVLSTSVQVRGSSSRKSVSTRSKVSK